MIAHGNHITTCVSIKYPRLELFTKILLDGPLPIPPIWHPYPPWPILEFGLSSIYHSLCDVIGWCLCTKPIPLHDPQQKKCCSLALYPCCLQCIAADLGSLCYWFPRPADIVSRRHRNTWGISKSTNKKSVCQVPPTISNHHGRAQHGDEWDKNSTAELQKNTQARASIPATGTL